MCHKTVPESAAEMMTDDSTNEGSVFDHVTFIRDEY